jgi:hypothetical protein
MKTYKENGKSVVEIDDLSFISNRNHKLGWLGLHLAHFRIKLALRKADKVLVPNEAVAWDVFMYYFIPKPKIFITATGKTLSESPHKS